ncbi:MAG: ABC-type oligopeptide uptake system ATPase component OppD [Rhodobacteraceae bacterium HLUCCA12]|nr:MAG: ABC-type oligopeptide uptake system ATPase component OppD [Rhodobacteraceae bacterium HLUCCA12]
MQNIEQDKITSSILSVDSLSVCYGSRKKPIKVVEDVSFDVSAGESLGIVGESGSGKSQTMLAVLRLLGEGGEITSGNIVFDGRDIRSLSNHAMKRVRGNGIALISQDALSALNPAMKVGRQMAEPLVVCDGMSNDASRRKCIDLLDRVGIHGAVSRLECYPHELSGGMRQRVLIAMAISRNPKVLIADEPTTALDVTIQAQILDLIDDLRKDLGMGLVLITHDLGVVAGIADRVSVMYGGRIVETGRTEQIFDAPRHPYTVALLKSIPKIDQSKSERLSPIPGLPVDPRAPLPGCSFSARCEYTKDSCTRSRPALLFAAADGVHQFRCPVDPFGARPESDAENLSRSGGRG